MNGAPAETAGRGSAGEVLMAFLRLGVTSFGGPVAHLAYFRAELVQRRGWVDEASYADVVALCQFLPGPASSQVGCTLGLLRAGLPGGLAAWLGFTLPSALLMLAFATALAHGVAPGQAGWTHGLRIVAVAVVAQAVWGMATRLCPDRPRISIAVAATLLVLAVPSPAGQIGAIALGALIGWRLLPGQPAPPAGGTLGVGLSPALASGMLVAFFGLLAGLPLLAAATGSHTLALLDRFYRAGALVFGGGHVILPLLQSATVPPGWIANDAFLAGYGAAQALPGPLSAFAAFLGAAMVPAPNGWPGGVLCLLAIYLPSGLLLLGVLPFWETLRRRAGVQAALGGVNASVVGLLLAALYTPVWTSAIAGPRDFSLGLLAFLLLAVWRLPPWSVVALGALAAGLPF
jgi:chromate transporter